MDAYLAEIRLFAGNFAPQNWMTCNGQLMSIAQYSALFALIGTTYGGDGQTTFALPDLRGRAPVAMGQGPGTSNYDWGQNSGSESTSLTADQLPAHTHMVNGSSTEGTALTPKGSFPALVPSDPITGLGVNVYGPGPGDVMMAPGMIAPTGNSKPFNVVQPVLAVTFMICINGLWPSRP